MANSFEGPGIQPPLGGSETLTGTQVCNHSQLAWDVGRNKGNVLSMTKQIQDPKELRPKEGNEKDPSFTNHHTNCMEAKPSAMERKWKNSREMKDSQHFPHFNVLKGSQTIQESAS